MKSDNRVNVLGLAKFAEVIGTQSANLSKQKDMPFFPKDIADYPFADQEPEPQTDEEKKERKAKRLVSDPVYLAEDVEKFILNSGIKHKKRALRRLHSLYGTSSVRRANYTMMIRGIGRTGKSLLSCHLSKERDLLLSHMVGRGDRKTICTVIYRVTRSNQQTQLRFSTDISNLWRWSDEASISEELAEIKKEYSLLESRPFIPITDPEIDQWFEQVEQVAKLIENYSKENNQHFNTFIRVDTEASNSALRIMDKVNTSILTAIDTAGADGEAEVGEIVGYSTPDINLLVFGDRPGQELLTCYQLISQNCKESIASAPVLFLYNGQDYDLSNFDNYEEIQESTKKTMKALDTYLDSFRKGSVAGTSISFFSPSDHSVSYLNLSTREGKERVEDKEFFKNLGDAIYDHLPEVTKDNLEDEIEDALREEGIALDEAGKFVDEILSSIPSHVWTGCKNVSDVFYSDNTHFRTYSSDYGRISRAISRAKQVEFTRLYNYFVGSEEAPSALNALEYPEKWKQLIISYIYFVLSSEVNMDYGIGIGGHQWEYQPPRTMLAEESLFAEDILKKVSDSHGTEGASAYIEVLAQEHGIESRSWERVNIQHTTEADLKLRLIAESERNPVNNLDEAILDTYVRGLLMTAEYKVMEFFKTEGDVIKKRVLSYKF